MSVEDTLWNLLDEKFPVWNQAEMDAMKPEDTSEKFEDEFGTLMPKFLTNYIDCWKRPDSLVMNNPSVPMVTFDEGSENPQQRKVKGEMFAGNDKGFEWLVAVMMAVKNQSASVAQNDFLWESIYPKDKSTGLPAVNPAGKYWVKCYFMKEWRRVDLDDRMPVDLFGRPLPVGIRPIQLWPLLLTKAILKLMAAFGVLEKTSPCDVPAFTWLTSWSTESIEPPNVSNMTGSLYDRLCDAKINKNIVVTCCLKERAASDRPPPRMVVLCGSSGVGIGEVTRKVLGDYNDSFGRCVSHTTRPPMEHEVFGLSYHFVDEEKIKAMYEDHQFLEYNKIEKYSKVFPGTYHYGTSLSTVREIAAAGKLCITTVDLQGCQDLYNREGVDALYIFVEPPSREFLEKKLTLRLKEAESTVDKRVEYAQSEIDSSSQLGPFDHEIPTADYETFLMEVKEAISALSPIIRNRIRGLPPYLLDYSDLIPSNSVEKPDVKPVIIAGPDDQINERIIQDLVDEFPDVFGFALRYTTREELDSTGDENKEANKQKYKYISEEEFAGMKEKDAFVEDCGDLFVHESLVKQYGTTMEEVQKCIDQSRLCIMKSSVAGTKKIKDSGMDMLSIFLAPPDMDTHRDRLRNYLAEPKSAIQSMLDSAAEMRKKAGEMGIFDKFIVNEDVDKAYSDLKDCISTYRPDIVPPQEYKTESTEEIIQSPLILCGPPGLGKTLMIEKLVSTYPDKFESCVSYTTRSPQTHEKDGVHYHFVDKKKMDSLIESGALLEHSEILGQTYASPLEDVKAISAKGKICILDCDIQGAEVIKQSEIFPDMLFFFVGPPSMEKFQMQLKDSGHNDESAQKKVDFATSEMEKLNEKLASSELAFSAIMVKEADDSAFFELQYHLSKAKLPRQIIQPVAKPVYICGPVGCGKHELINHLFNTFPGKFAAPLIHTSREPSEKGESDYVFVSRDFFEDGVESGKFLYQEEALDNLYGLSVDSVEEICKQGKVPIIDIDTVEQAERVKKMDSDSLFIFVGPKSLPDVKEKLLRELEKTQPPRYTVEEALSMRLDYIQSELEAASAVMDNIFDNKIEVTSREMVQLEVQAKEQIGNVSYHKLLESISLYVPQQITRPQVWGYGQQLWDESTRNYGQMQLKVIILGPAGSGKTTQCKMLSEKYLIPIISPGLLLYDEVQNKTEIGLQAKVYMDSTKTVPEDLIVKVIKMRIAKPDCQLQGWLLDGFPHTTKEADALSKAGIIPDKVVFLESRQDVLLWRCKGRRIDPSNPHNVYFDPPTNDSPPEILSDGSGQAGILPLNEEGEEDSAVSSRLTIRHDDTEENFRNRIHKYDIYAAGIKSEYNVESIYVPSGDTGIPQGDDKKQWSRLSPQQLFDSIVDFLTIEDRREKEIEMIESKKLVECQYSIVDTVKFRRKCVVKLQQQTGPFLGRSFWVNIDDICSNTHCVNFNHNSKEIANWKDINSSDATVRDRTYILHVESEEPIRLLATLSLAPQYSLKDSPDVSMPEVAPLVFICGPSGVGKSTLINMLLQGYKDKFAYVKRRTSDSVLSKKKFKDFAYSDKEFMEENIRKNMFLEYVEKDGEYCGTYKQDVEEVVGKMCIFRTDTNSVKAIKENDSEVKKLFIFIAPKSEEILDKRLRLRGLDDEETIQKKLVRGKQEILSSQEEGVFDHIVLNDDLSSAYMSLLNIVSGMWPKNNLSSECNATVGLFDFETQEKVKPSLTKLSPKIEQTVVMDFLRGKHSLQLSVDKNFAYNFNFVSMTPFEVENDFVILKDKNDFKVFEISGNYIEQESRAWSVWFRRIIEIKKPTLVTLRLHAVDHRMKSHMHLNVINNDDASVEKMFVTTETAPLLFKPNERGYNILGYSRNSGSDSLAESSWKLVTYSDDQDFELQESYSDNTQVLTDSYAANINFLVCRYVLKITEWTQISFLAEVLGDDEHINSVKAGIRVSIIKVSNDKKKEEGGEEGGSADKEVPRQFLEYEVVQSWDVVSLLTVPAFNIDQLENDGSSYMVQIVLTPEKCNFELQASGEASVPLQWKLHINSTSKSIEIVKDESREVYFQSVLDTWNSAGGDPTKRAAAALKSLDSYEESIKSEEASKEELHRTGKDGVEVLLSPSKHKRKIQSTKSFEERTILNETTDALNKATLNDATTTTTAAAAENTPSGAEDLGKTLGSKKENKAELSTKRKAEKDAALNAIMELRQKGMEALGKFVKTENDPADQS